MKKYYILPGIVGVISSIMSFPFIVEAIKNYFHWLIASIIGMLCSMFVGYFFFCFIFSSHFIFRQLRKKLKVES